MSTACLRWPCLLQQPPDVSTSGGGIEVYKLEQVSSDDHQMSLAGGRASARAGKVSQRCHVCGGGLGRCPKGAMYVGEGWDQALYSEFQCIMRNDLWEHPPL